MLSNDDKIILWRNTLQLFHHYNRPIPFEGPFKKAGLTNYIVERLCITRHGKDIKPDIIASGESGWLVLEMTTQLGSKNVTLDSYQQIDPGNLVRYQLAQHKISPDIIISRLSSVDDGAYCQIIVRDRLEIKKLDIITNQNLRSALADSEGTNLTRLPEIPITLLPEMKGTEIRRGLIDIVMQLFDPNCEGKALIEIVHIGLERLSNLIGVSEITGLKRKVKDEMVVLIQEFLEDYLEFDADTEAFRATKKFNPQSKSMEFVASRLREWAGYGPQTTLPDMLPGFLSDNDNSSK